MVVGQVDVKADQVAFETEEQSLSIDNFELPEIDGDISIALRMNVLRHILAMGIRPEQDLLFKAEYLPEVWRQDKRILGIKVHNQIDLHQLEGWLDIREIDLTARDGLWTAQIIADGHATGIAKGKAYGIGVNLPFVAQPHLFEQVPIALEQSDRGFALQLTDQTVRLDLEMEVRIGGRDISFVYPIETPLSGLLKNVSLPSLIQEDVRVPARIEKKKIVEKRVVDVAFFWRPSLPSSADGYLVIQGTLPE